jgi:adenylate cyclase
MATEIERKFLVLDDSWKERVEGLPLHLQQGYLSFGGKGVEEVRVRLQREGDLEPTATIDTKSKGGLVRTENTVAIEAATAEHLLGLCLENMIDKIRYRVPAASGHTIEVDVYQNDLAGLVVAEIELGSADEPFDRASFLGEEVTEDGAYKNASLAQHGRPRKPGLKPR